MLGRLQCQDLGVNGCRTPTLARWIVACSVHGVWSSSKLGDWHYDSKTAHNTCLAAKSGYLLMRSLVYRALILSTVVSRSTALGSYWLPGLGLQLHRPHRTPSASASSLSCSPRARPQPWPSTTAPSTWGEPSPLLLSLWLVSWALNMPTWESLWCVHPLLVLLLSAKELLALQVQFPKIECQPFAPCALLRCGVQHTRHRLVWTFALH